MNGWQSLLQAAPLTWQAVHTDMASQGGPFSDKGLGSESHTSVTAFPFSFLKPYHVVDEYAF